MINTGTIKRDLALLASLIFMVKIAFDRQHREVVPPVIYAPAKQTVALKTMALPAPVPSENPAVEDPAPQKTEPTAPFVVHEVNNDIVHQMETAQAHITQLLAIVPPATKHAAQLKSMQQRLTQLKKEYKTTSPAIALLGPLGTAGIVMKETEIEKNLLRMINMTRTIAQALTNKNEEKTLYTSISHGLEQNALIISSLHKPSASA